MAFRERVLPQWLINLGSGVVPPKKNTDSSTSRGNKKHVNTNDDNVNHTPADENDKKPQLANGNTGKSVSNSVMISEITSPKKSPRKQVNRQPRAQPEMSSSDEEVEVKPDLALLKETILCAGSFVDSHAAPVPSFKKENEGNNVTKVEFDPSIKTESPEESLGNEEQEIKGIESNDAETCLGNDSGNIVDVSADTGDATGGNTYAGSGVDILVDANADCDPSTSVDAANVNDADGDQSNSVSSTTDNSNKINRPKCKYGAQCYRKNPQHLEDFSHPDDSDYSTADNRPECQYGLACYRKNPLHRQHYKHTKKVQKPRQAKRPRKKLADNGASDEDEDQYDLDDPFIDNGSSDDYEPSGSGSETDFEVEEEAGSDDDKKDVKDPNKLKRKHKN